MTEKMRLLIVLLLCVCGGLATPVAAQRYWSDDQVPYCSDTTPGVCRPEVLALLLRKLQVPEAEALAAEGYVGVRVFRFDAFGVIWPMTSFVSRPINQYRREGAAEARTIHADGHVAVLARPVWESGWRDVDEIIQQILEQPPSEERPLQDPQAPPVLQRCLHVPTVIIEVLENGRAHRWWPDMACRKDPAVVRAYRIAELIGAAFPHCAHFPIERFGMGAGRLRACLMTDGPEPLSAIEVMEILRPSISGDSSSVYEEIRQSADVRLLSIDGQQTEGRAAVLAALKQGALGERWLRILRATGDSQGVTVRGQLNQVGQINNPDPLDVTLRWTKEGDGEWRITEWLPEQR